MHGLKSKSTYFPIILCNPELMLRLIMRKTEISIPTGLQEKIHWEKTQTNGIVRTWRKSAKTILFKLQRNQTFNYSTFVNMWEKQILEFIFTEWAWLLIQKIFRHWKQSCVIHVYKSESDSTMCHFPLTMCNFYLWGNFK